MLTFQFVALLTVFYVYLQESKNQWDVQYKPDTDGSNFGFPIKWYRYDKLKRHKNKMLGWVALCLSFLGILLWIWTQLP